MSALWGVFLSFGGNKARVVPFCWSSMVVHRATVPNQLHFDKYYTYAVKAHPELAKPVGDHHDTAVAEIVFSFMTNRRDGIDKLFEEGELATYVPQFVRIRFDKIPCSPADPHC